MKGFTRSGGGGVGGGPAGRRPPLMEGWLALKAAIMPSMRTGRS